MSTAVPDIDTSDATDAERSFIVEAALSGDLAVGKNDAGEIVVSCHAHDAEASISGKPAIALAARHDLDVVDVIGRWDAKGLEVIVAEDGWQRDEEPGGSA